MCLPTEREEAPFVAAGDERANQAGDNHDPVDENDVKNRDPRHAGGEKQIHQEQGRGYEPKHKQIQLFIHLFCHTGPRMLFRIRTGPVLPVNVAHVVNLARETAHDGIRPKKLDADRRPAEMGAHGKVGNEGNHGDGSRQIVKGPVLARLLMAEEEEDGSREAHDCADGEIGTRPVLGESDVGHIAIDSRTCARGRSRAC